MSCYPETRISNLLKQCTFKQLKQIHAFIVTSSLQRKAQFFLKFLRRSTEFGGMKYSELVFSQLDSTDSTQTALWNVMIRGYAYHGPFEKCMKMFDEMPQRGLKPNNFTYPYAISSCSELGWCITGQTVQSQALKAGFEHSVAVAESLFKFYLNMADTSKLKVDRFDAINGARKIFNGIYSKPVELWNRMICLELDSGDICSARKVFDQMPERDIVSWNSMVSGYARFRDAENAIDLFQRMPEKNVLSWTLMVGLYMGAGDVESARNMFDKMPQKNLVSWNSMISGYTQNDKFEEALDLFTQMHLEGKNPDGYTFVSVLTACSHLGAMEYGRWVHSLMKDWHKLAVIVGTALTEMYSKCGDINKAFLIFFKIQNKDVFCYNVMIKSLAIHGRTEDSIKLFHMLQKSGLKANNFTFASVLFACSHGGFVEEGRRIFSSMDKEHGIKPSLDHYGCMVDLLSRNGQVEEAENMIKEMPFKPDVAIWGALLGGCLVRGDLKVAKRVMKKAQDEKGIESGVHVLLANIHASVGQWQEAEGARDMMEGKKIWKKTGFSSLTLS